MTKRKSKLPSPIAWIDQLDPDDIATAYDEATTDANGEDELVYGLITMAHENLVFPFPANVLGQVVQIVGSEPAERDEFGLDLIAELDGQQHRIAVRSVELLTPLPEGAVYLAAFLNRPC